MSKYKILLVASSATKTVVVEAENQDDAEAKAFSGPFVEEGPVIWDDFDPDESHVLEVDGVPVE